MRFPVTTGCVSQSPVLQFLGIQCPLLALELANLQAHTHTPTHGHTENSKIFSKYGFTLNLLTQLHFGESCL